MDKFKSLTSSKKFALIASVFFLSYLLLFSFLKTKIDDLNYRIDSLEAEKFELQQLLKEADDAFNRQAELHKKRKDRD